jgi:hypothetical protein
MKQELIAFFLVHQNRGYGAGASISLMVASVPPAKFG